MPSPVEQIVEQAARRRLLVKAAEQLSWAAVFLLAGLAILLLTGSAIFQPIWLLLLLLVGTAIAGYRLRGCILPRYRVAQHLDARFHLHDTLSTAYYLRTSDRHEGTGAAQYALEQADRLAPTISVAQSFPFSGHKLWGVAGVLAVACAGLFTARFLLVDRGAINFRPSLVNLDVSPALARIYEVLSPKKDREKVDALPNLATTTKDVPGTQKDLTRSPQPEPPSPTPSHASADSGQANGQMTSIPDKSNPEDGQMKPGGTPMAKSNGPRNTSQSNPSQPNDPASRTAGPQQTSENKPEPAASNQSSSPGLMSRMKDAVSNMMAKMQAAASPQAQAKSGQQSSGEQKNGEQAQASNGRPQQGNQSQQQQQAQNQASNPNEAAEGQAQGQTAEKQGAMQGKSSDQSAQRGSDAHSGVGQQDGSKDLQNAEQLKAMGKLEEIIGKRSAELTGDMTVETSSGKQQLKTNYSQRLGQHSDSGGEINHNQVPLERRQYVRDYMEQVRKQDKGSQ